MERNRRSSLTSNPKITRKGHEENIRSLRNTTVKTRKLRPVTKKNKTLAENVDSPSSLKNIAQNESSKSNKRKCSRGKKKSYNEHDNRNSSDGNSGLSSQSRKSSETHVRDKENEGLHSKLQARSSTRSVARLPEKRKSSDNLSEQEISPKNRKENDLIDASPESNKRHKKSMEDNVMDRDKKDDNERQYLPSKRSHRGRNKKRCNPTRSSKPNINSKKSAKTTHNWTDKKVGPKTKVIDTLLVHDKQQDKSVKGIGKEDLDDNSVVMLETGGNDIKPALTPSMQTCILSSDSIHSPKHCKDKTVVLEASDGDNCVPVSTPTSCPETPTSSSGTSAENKFLSDSKFNSVKNWLDDVEPHCDSPSSSSSDQVTPPRKIALEPIITLSPLEKNILGKCFGREWRKRNLFSRAEEAKRKKNPMWAIEPGSSKNMEACPPATESEIAFNIFTQNLRVKMFAAQAKWLLSHGDVKLPLTRKKKKGTIERKVGSPLPKLSNEESSGKSGEKTTVVKKVPVKKSLALKRSRKSPVPPAVLNFLTSLSDSLPAEQCDPRAQMFKKQFKKMKDTLVAELFALYNEQVFDNLFPKDMKITWNPRMRSTAGFCYNRKVVNPTDGNLRTSRIVLSTKVCATPDRVRDTLLHELCHAATWIGDENRGCHGPFWKAWAARAKKRLPVLPPVKRCHSYVIEKKILYRCTQCGYSFGRQSKSLDLNRKVCGRCYGKFELLVNSKPKNSSTAVPRAPRNPTGFALYVKNNYHLARGTKFPMSHKEVMQLLGKKFSELKVLSAAKK